jgi:hypothetical protein
MIRLTIIATCILFKIFLPNFAFASNLNPEKILDSVDDLYRSNTSYGYSYLISDNKELAKNSYVRAMVQRRRLGI